MLQQTAMEVVREILRVALEPVLERAHVVRRVELDAHETLARGSRCIPAAGQARSGECA
jgi:hypothetical protein